MKVLCITNGSIGKFSPRDCPRKGNVYSVVRTVESLTCLYTGTNMWYQLKELPYIHSVGLFVPIDDDTFSGDANSEKVKEKAKEVLKVSSN